MTAFRATILAIGDELLLGEKVDTNSAWLAAQVIALGGRPVAQRTLADDRAAIACAMAEAEGDVVLVTGGLGPTADDLTRFALGDVVAPGQSLLTDDAAADRLRAFFERHGRVMPASNLVQVQHPVGTTLLKNPNGTAPGLFASTDTHLLACLPGPPREMKPMFEALVAPALRERFGSAAPLVTTLVHAFGLGESAAAERLGDLMTRGRDPEIGTTASAGVVTARVRGTDTAAVARDVEQVAALWAPFVYGTDGVTLSSVVQQMLRAAGQTLATAESCTGGALAAALVDEPGSSDVFAGGWVTYANERKTADLGVSDEVLATHGAVSEPVARAMALGAARRAGASTALSTTGIAGPGGEVPGKPVGTVYVGLARRVAGSTWRTHVRRFRFSGSRTVVRQRTVDAALQMLRHTLAETEHVTFGWESEERLAWEEHSA